MSAPLPEQYRRSIKKELCSLGGERGGGGGVNLKEIVFENKDRRGLQTFFKIMIITSQETRPRVKCRLKKMIHQKEP